MKRMANIHPGEVLREEFLIPMNITVYRLSKETGLSQTRLGQIIAGKRGITAETAVKLGKALNVPAQFWMNLQVLFDIEEAEVALKNEIRSIHPIQANAA
jgi:antitoxin HigA-1